MHIVKIYYTLIPNLLRLYAVQILINQQIGGQIAIDMDYGFEWNGQMEKTPVKYQIMMMLLPFVAVKVVDCAQNMN